MTEQEEEDLHDKMVGKLMDMHEAGRYEEINDFILRLQPQDYSTVELLIILTFVNFPFVKEHVNNKEQLLRKIKYHFDLSVGEDESRELLQGF